MKPRSARPDVGGKGVHINLRLAQQCATVAVELVARLHSAIAVPTSSQPAIPCQISELVKVIFLLFTARRMLLIRPRQLPRLIQMSGRRMRQRQRAQRGRRQPVRQTTARLREIILDRLGEAAGEASADRRAAAAAAPPTGFDRQPSSTSAEGISGRRQHDKAGRALRIFEQFYLVAERRRRRRAPVRATGCRSDAEPDRSGPRRPRAADATAARQPRHRGFHCRRGRRPRDPRPSSTR